MRRALGWTGWTGWFAVCLLVLGSASPVNAEDEERKVVKDGSKVSIDYTLKLEDGTVADSSAGDEPLVYEQGAGQMLPALEQKLAGLAVGEERQVTLPPEQGYGPVQEELFQAVPVEQIPEDARQAGAILVAQDSEGKQRRVRVHEVRETEIVIDLNHPLAGKTLLFDVKVVAIE